MHPESYLKSKFQGQKDFKKYLIELRMNNISKNSL